MEGGSGLVWKMRETDSPTCVGAQIRIGFFLDNSLRMNWFRLERRPYHDTGYETVKSRFWTQVCCISGACKTLRHHIVIHVSSRARR